jgi:hypothetical protein
MTDEIDARFAQLPYELINELLGDLEACFDVTLSERRRDLYNEAIQAADPEVKHLWGATKKIMASSTEFPPLTVVLRRIEQSRWHRAHGDLEQWMHRPSTGVEEGIDDMTSRSRRLQEVEA